MEWKGGGCDREERIYMGRIDHAHGMTSFMVVEELSSRAGPHTQRRRE